MPKQPQYLIVGAGIGGLAVGLALLRAGHSVRILEAAPRLGEVGAGISLSPNAVLALQHVGLGQVLNELADCPARTAVFHYRTGEALAQAEFGTDFVERYGARYYQIHRADLRHSLVRAVQDIDAGCIKLDAEVAGVQQTDSDVVVRCQDGLEVNADVVIGCDGLRSVVRDTLFPTSTPKWTGQVAYRATLPESKVHDHLRVAPTAVTIGPGHIVTRYIIRHGEMVNLVAIAQSEAWKEEGWSHPATVAEVLAEHEDWNADVLALINAIPPENLFKWALYTRKPLSSWIRGKVVLLGDAAHPMLPFLGMGAAITLEDAVVFARCIDAYRDTDVSLARYEAARIGRANETARDSQAQGKILQGADPDEHNWGRQAASDISEWKRYGYDPASVEI